MSKTQRWITAGILCALAVLCACMTAHVLKQAEPENLLAFENRFANLTSLGIAADETVTLTVNDDLAGAEWENSSHAWQIQTERIPVKADHRVLVNMHIGGQQNAFKQDRWNYRLWMEMTTFMDGMAAGTHRIEVPLASDAQRSRLYAMCVEGAADSYQVIWQAEPVNGFVGAGKMQFSMWEVYAE